MRWAAKKRIFGEVTSMVRRFGNGYTSGNPVFSVLVSNESEAQICDGSAGGHCDLALTLSGAATGGDGSSWMAFVLTRSGRYSLSLQLSEQDFDGLGTALGGSPYTVQCLPQNAGPPGSLIALPSTVVATAGEPTALEIDEYDAFGNRRDPAVSPWAPVFTLRTLDVAHSSDPPLVLAAAGTAGGTWLVQLVATRAGSYQLAVMAGAADSVLIPSDFGVFSVKHGAISPNGTQDGRGVNYVGYTDAMVDDRPILAIATNKFLVLAGDVYGNLITSFDPPSVALGLGSRLSVYLTLAARSYQALVNVSDPVNGQFLVSFISTVSGWFRLSISFDGMQIQRSPSSLYICSGFASGNLSYPCFYQGQGCFDGVHDDPGFPTCSRLLNPVAPLFCATVTDSAPALGYVRIRDRWSNDRGEQHWEDFVRYNVSALQRPGDSVQVFSDAGCFAGETSDTACGPSSQTTKALNIDSQGLVLPSNQIPGTTTFLYPISFIATRSGAYFISLAHGVMAADRVTKTIQGGISPNSQFSAIALPDVPYAPLSRAIGQNQTIAGAVNNMLIITFDRFNNARVVSPA